MKTSKGSNLRQRKCVNHRLVYNKTTRNMKCHNELKTKPKLQQQLKLSDFFKQKLEIPPIFHQSIQKTKNLSKKKAATRKEQELAKNEATWTRFTINPERRKRRPRGTTTNAAAIDMVETKQNLYPISARNLRSDMGLSRTHLHALIGGAGRHL